jgi:hypothetical protein
LSQQMKSNSYLLLPIFKMTEKWTKCEEGGVKIENVFFHIMGSHDALNEFGIDIWELVFPKWGVKKNVENYCNG